MLIFLYGEDTFRSCQKLEELKNKFIHSVDPRKENISIVNGANILWADLNQTLSASSLLVNKRMIIVKDIFSNKSVIIFEQILNYFQNFHKTQNNNVVIFLDSLVKVKKTKIKEEFLIVDSTGRNKILTKHPLAFFKFLYKQPYSQQFNCLSNTAMASWIKQTVKERGKEITLATAQFLVSLVGNNLWQINNEINKLINYQSANIINSSLSQANKTANNNNGDNKLNQFKRVGANQTIISEEDIKKIVRGNFDENIFALTDAISNKNKALATRLLEEQIEAGLTSGYLLNMFIRQFKILLQIKQAVELNYTARKIASELKIHPFVVQKGINQVRCFSLFVLKNITNQLIKIDYKMKTGKTDVLTALNILIAKI